MSFSGQVGTSLVTIKAESDAEYVVSGLSYEE